MMEYVTAFYFQSKYFFKLLHYESYESSYYF